jgi:hypothetical protein
MAQSVDHVPGPGKLEDEGRSDPKSDERRKKDRGPAPRLLLSREDPLATSAGQERQREHGQDRVFLRRAHEGKWKHDAPENGVHRQVLAQGKQKRKTAEPSQDEDQAASPAKGGESQG